MKAIYHTEVHFSLVLKTGEIVKDYNTHHVTYYRYNYGELPETSVQEYDNPDTVFEDLMKVLGYTQSYTGEKTLFKKRQYMNDYTFSRRIYKDELVYFKIIHKYVPHNNLSAKEAQDKLTFADYTQLIFDREQELKSMLLTQKENKP